MSANSRPWLDDPAWRAALAEQLGDEIARLRLLLHREIDWMRHRSRREPLAGKGAAVVTDDQALAALAGPDPAGQADFHRANKVSRRVASLDGVLRERSAAMIAAGTPFPIDEMVSLFGLDEFTRDTIVLALAPEVDPEIQRLYAYAQDDATARHATPALAVALFGPPAYPRRDTREAFRPAGTLTRLAFLGEDPRVTGGAATRPLWLAPRIAWFLRGTDQPRTSAGLTLRQTAAAPVPVEFATTGGQVAAALERIGAGPTPRQ